MIIQNPEALKSWLTAVLAPLYDGEPAELASQVLALAKKKKPESELRRKMTNELFSVLHHETKGFIDQLFVTLETKSYLQSNPEPPSVKVESTTTAATGQPIIPPVVTVPVQSPRPVPSAPSTGSRVKKSSSDRTKKRSRSPKSRSRSRSPDRDRDRTARRSRSREPRDYQPGCSSWDDRRQSPVRDRRSDRTRSRSPLKPRRSSPSPRDSRRARSPSPSPHIAAALDNVVLAPELDLPPPVGAPAADPAMVVRNPVILANCFRCPDYEVTGRCPREDGLLCPYDHGNVPPNAVLFGLLNVMRPPNS